MTAGKNTEFIKALALQYGFDHCGIAKAAVLDEDAKRLENWLNKGMHGTMHYMENHFDMRIDPSRLVPGVVLAAEHQGRSHRRGVSGCSISLH